MNPPASPLHQSVAWRIRQIIHAPPGHEAVQAVGIRIPGGSYLIPDVAVIPVDKITADINTLDAADVLVAVEIISPTSQFLDRETKPRLYAHGGIPEFRLVATGQVLTDTVIHVYLLADGEYRPARTFQLPT